MRLRKKKEFFEPLSDKDLSRYWYCPKDKVVMQINRTRLAQTPNFSIFKENIEISLHNVVAVKKIPEEAIEETKKIVDYILSHDPNRNQIEFVSVKCPNCGDVRGAPRISKVENIKGINTGKQLYASNKKLENKEFGRFRTVDKIGLGRSSNDDSSNRPSMFFWAWIIGIYTFFMILIFYYILGLEMKIKDRWIPIGGIFFTGLILMILYNVIFGTLLDDFKRIVLQFF